MEICVMNANFCMLKKTKKTFLYYPVCDNVTLKKTMQSRPDSGKVSRQIDGTVYLGTCPVLGVAQLLVLNWVKAFPF